MTDAPQPDPQSPPPAPPAQSPPDPNALEWMYMANGQQVGPVSKPQLEAMVTAGQLGIDTPVWRNGMAAWAPIGSFSDPDYRPPAQRRVFKNATQNCIAMFVVAMLGIMGSAGAAFARVSGSSVNVSCVGLAAATGGIFAMIYLPLRWKVIMQQSPVVRVLGLIGGFILVGFGILGILAMVATFSNGIG